MRRSQQAFSAPSKQTQSSNAKDELSSTASINASSTTLIPSSELLASKPRDSTLKREQNSCYEHDNGLHNPHSSRKPLAALPRNWATQRRARQWRSVPPYAPPGISDHVGWSVQRRKCVIEELAVRLCPAVPASKIDRGATVTRDRRLALATVVTDFLGCAPPADECCP